ncbi:hypothetical protein A9Q84_00345 [Halobacteriovorax marinus]|uniref:Uncharacterized protein n=1 Tax=Halobacteriovorax marinus TaxID=97084 RepID=A0A1Y5FBB4_9BACT|nr:hypothetical protein A9Q84_00345 [Halobacteriovorax marinus]
MNSLNKETIKKLAMKTNTEVWNYFGKEHITQEEISLMLENAYTSLNLWAHVGGDINLARGHWMLARAFCVANNKEQAELHANKCKDYTDSAIDSRRDFDVFYSLEGLARACALNEDRESAKVYYSDALRLAESITDKETRDLCLDDIKSAPWFGMDF